MKLVLTLIAFASLALLSLASPLTFTNVTISSVVGRKVTVANGKGTVQCRLLPSTEYFSIVNGKRVRLSTEEGRSRLTPGAVVTIKGRQEPKGIIAVLIALFK